MLATIARVTGVPSNEASRRSRSLASRRACAVTINFINADGVQMIEASTFVLLPGKAQFVDFKGSNLRLAERSDRAQFRTGIDVLHNPPGDLPCGGVATTVEIFDANGHTNAVVAHHVQFWAMAKLRHRGHAARGRRRFPRDRHRCL